MEIVLILIGIEREVLVLEVLILFSSLLKIDLETLPKICNYVGRCKQPTFLFNFNAIGVNEVMERQHTSCTMAMQM